MFTTLLSFTILISNPCFESPTPNHGIEAFCEEDKKYAVVATTRGLYDYAVNCRIEATCIGSCSISYVEVATSYGYERVSHMSDFNGGYQFSYEGYTYYFSF